MCNVVPSHKCVSVLIYDHRRNEVVDFVLRVQFENVDFARLGCYTRVYVAVRVTKVQHPTKYGVPRNILLCSRILVSVGVHIFRYFLNCERCN